MTREEIKDLLDNYLSGDLSTEERARLIAALETPADLARLEQELLQSFQEDRFILPSSRERDERMAQLVAKKLAVETTGRAESRARIIPWVRLAAASVVIIAAGLFYLNQRSGNKTPEKNEIASVDIRPGKTGAILTLADGSSIVLDSVPSNKTLQQGASELVLGKDGLTYNQKQTENNVTYNTLQVPRGRQYNLTLSDGTRVWLNAASTLRYPTAFSGEDRVVEVSGEAYFEVAHLVTKPFIVKKGETGIRVLGTHFNVHAYDDEDTEEITLLQGSVEVTTAKKTVTLNPGEQARIDDDLRILPGVDTEEVVAWKEGKFQFGETADIRSVMHQISNWYDVDVVYKGNITKHIGGTISRQVNLSQLLKILQATGTVKFNVEGRTIEVSP